LIYLRLTPFSLPCTKTNFFNKLVNKNNKKTPPPNFADRDTQAHILANKQIDDFINTTNNKRECVQVDNFKTPNAKKNHQQLIWTEQCM
jgi:hypothetical protein